MKTLLIFLFVVIITSSYGQNSPMEIVEKVFSKEKEINIKDYCTGKYQKDNCRPNGSDIKDKFKLENVFVNDTNAIVEMILIDSLKREFLNVYIYLKHDSLWKINAIKENPVFQIEKQKELDKYRNYSDNQLDSICRVSHCRSVEYLRQELQRLTLLNSVDKQIISFFVDNTAKFDSLFALSKLQNNNETYTDELLRIARNLCIQDIGFENEMLQFKIGEEVGYIHVENNKHLSNCLHRNYLIIKKITDKWYFYRKE